MPWIYDEEAVDVLRYFTKLKCRLMPYSVRGGRRGGAKRRADRCERWVLEFPDEPACETLDRQYMLGPSLLVAPVFSEEGEARV